MIFRYRIEFVNDFCGNEFYHVDIQKYNLKFPHWKTAAKSSLRDILLEINADAFNNHKYLSCVKYEELLEEIQKYASIEDIITRYIMNVVIKHEKEINNEMSVKETIDKLVLTNGWKTIEVKENDK